MICHAFHIGGWIGERVHRTSIYANLPVHAGLAHLFFKRRHLSEGHYGVHRAVADKDLAPDIASIIRLWAGHSSVETYNSHQGRTTARQFERRGTSETIAHGRELARIHILLARQSVERRLRSASPARDVRPQITHQFPRVRHV